MIFLLVFVKRGSTYRLEIIAKSVVDFYVEFSDMLPDASFFDTLLRWSVLL